MQALQASLMTHEVMVHESKRLQDLEVKYGKCQSKLRVAQDLASTYLQTAKEVQDELDEFTAKVKVMEREMQDEAQKLITRHAMKARVEAVMEYFKGEHASWDVNEMVRIYNEAYPDDAFPLHVQGGGDEVDPVAVKAIESKSPVSDVPEDDVPEKKAPEDEDVQKSPAA